MDIHKLLHLTAERGASDLHMLVPAVPTLRVNGALTPVDGEKQLTPKDTEEAFESLTTEKQRERFYSELELDFAYGLPGVARFRVNIFSQSGCLSIVLRKLESKIPTIEELNLPDAMHKIALEKNGIVFVTGATGSGKTTSLATILNEINEDKSVHVVTLEDPVEYQHPHKKSTFNQRELGIDFETYAGGLRAALRQAPKVILVGEMRDRETVEIGLSAAETGHLVLTTLHTIDVGSTVNRIIGMFSTEEEKQIRIRMADAVRWIVCQRLLPKIGGGRVASFEILGTNLRVKDVVLHGEAEGKTFYEIMQAGKAFGMTTFDENIVGLYEQGLITQETALAYASRRGVVGRGIDSIKSARGEATTDIEKLEIDRGYKVSA